VPGSHFPKKNKKKRPLADGRPLKKTENPDSSIATSKVAFSLKVQKMGSAFLVEMRILRRSGLDKRTGFNWMKCP
jgi:hypothetical protein